MCVEVDLDAAIANWRTFAALSSAEAAAVVKADGYGLGAAPLARAFRAAGATTFFVATPAEGAALRAALDAEATICVLGGYRAEDLAMVRDARLRPVLNGLDQAQAWIAAGRPGDGCVVHVDTGMNRLGAPLADIGALAALDLRPALVMSHLACGGDPGAALNGVQRRRFLEAALAFPGARRSLSASGGAFLGPDYAFDLVRPGVGLYGGAPLDAGGGPPLRAVARVTAPVLQIRTIEAGATVGYGATFTAPHPMQVATLGAGYADGLLRSLSGRGYAVLAGARRPMLGRVSMDLITVDATGLAVAPGDEADLIGPGLGVDEVAAAAGTLAYEVLTSLRGAARTYKGGAA